MDAVLVRAEIGSASDDA
jgi:hypothetical protein